MKRPARLFSNVFGGFHSLLVPVACAAALCACTNTDSEDGAGGEEAPAALPSPGSIDVVRPLALTERGRVPEKEPGFLDADVEEGRLVLTHDGRLPAIHAGDVLAGTDGGGYLVRVVRVREEAAGRVVLDTAPAALTELLGDGEIHVRYDAADYARRLREAVTAGQARGDEDGEAIASQAQALQVSGGAFVNLIDLAGAGLPASCGVGAEGQADIDVSATLMPTIDIDLEIGAKGHGNPAPELKKLRFVASGMLQVDATLHATGTVSGSCTVDLLKLAGGAPGLTLPPLTFWVGPVPVIITTEVVPVAKVKVGLDFEAAEVTADAHAIAGLDAGVEYTNKHWGTVWEPWGTAGGSASIEAPGAITASCRVSAGAELRARLYGILGPTVGVEAYARATAVTEPPYCTYEGSTDGGVRAYARAEAGISLGPLDLTLVSLPLVECSLLHFDGPDFDGTIPGAAGCGVD